jgi:hypothetical protein
VQITLGNDALGIKVQYDGQKDPALTGANLGDVTNLSPGI